MLSTTRPLSLGLINRRGYTFWKYLKLGLATVTGSTMTSDLKNWKGCQTPQRKVFDGRYVRLEPFDCHKHSDGLQAASSGEGADARMRYLWEVPGTRDETFQWVQKVQNLDDPIFYAVVDKQSGKVGGRQSFLRIDAPHGVVEIGHILWGPLISRRPAATEALYLFACHAFDELGYRRLEWKCHNDNGPSKNAARRFGFTLEGIFRQHMVMKGGNRDTAWFSIIDKEWPMLKSVYEKWLDPSNFDENGTQIKRLEDFK